MSDSAASSSSAVPAIVEIPSKTPAPLSQALPSHEGARRFGKRFIALYIGLALIVIGAVTSFVVILNRSGAIQLSAGWSSWSPPHGSTSAVTSSIAQHVAQEYHLNKAGAQLLAVVSGPPQLANGTHKIVMSNIAVRTTAGQNAGIQVFPTNSTWTDQLCGLGTACSIATGQPSFTRGRLVRREALEVALYTFKFVPGIDSVVAFMPPPAGQTTAELLYLQKSQLQQQLSQPLTKTLPLVTPPLPNSTDPKEATTIDKLTLPSIYSYTVQGLQDNSALLILDPVKT
jgi:hypothetical protein